MSDDRDLLPGEYAALAFLAIEPAHGYTLHQRWAESPLAEIAPVEQSLLYAHLRTLERRALVEWEEVRTGRRPTRRVYQPSEEGWSVLRSWLRTPVYRMREVRTDLLLKIYFLEQLDPVSVRPLVVTQVDICERYLADARTRLAASEGFEQLIHSSRASAAQATLDWLTTYRPPRGGRVSAKRAAS